MILPLVKVNEVCSILRKIMKESQLSFERCDYMTEIEQIIREVKIALSRITQGKWVSKQREFAGGSCAIYLGELDFDGFDHHKAENAEFITNAPTWLSTLITTIESQKECWDDAEMRASDAIAERNDLQNLVESQKKEIEQLKGKIKSWHADIYGFNHLSVDCTKRLIAEMESAIKKEKIK
jgi:hypothetical protein